MRSGRRGVSFTIEETASTSKAARFVGGYDALISVKRERRATVATVDELRSRATRVWLRPKPDPTTRPYEQ